MKKKLRSRLGLTLTELLVSLAIMGFLAAGVSGGIVTAAAAQRDSLALSESLLLLDSVTKAVIGELRYATQVTDPSAVPTVTPPAGYTVSYACQADYLSAVYGLNTRFYTAVNAEGMPRIFVEAKGGDYPILGEGAYSDLGAEIVSLTYEKSTEEFVVQLAITLPSGTRQEYPEFRIYPVYKS